jgi:Mg-chelatase subunit ChlD
MTENTELTIEQLKAYNIVIGVDFSGSMTSPYKDTTRINYVKEAICAFARWAEEFDSDGLTIITFATEATIQNGVKADMLDAIFANRPNGSTNLLAAIYELGKFHAAAEKPTVALFFTDGEPNGGEQGREGVAKALIGISNTLNADEDFAISFIQVGDDAGAAAFLSHLDDGLQSKGAKFDVVDTITQEQAETMTLPQIIAKTLND